MPEEILGGFTSLTLGQVVMMLIAGGLLTLAIAKQYEPLLLIPISVGILLANLPLTGMLSEDGILGVLKKAGLDNELFPLLIFLGLGALTDFTPMIQRPETILLGAAAQLGIFGALLLAVLFGFSLQEAGAIGIIGSADGPTSIYVSTKLASEELWGPIAVAAYSYMAMVPLIQPPIMRLLTTKKERATLMPMSPRPVSRRAKVMLPIAVIILSSLIVPRAAPLIGMLMFGNLLRESAVVERLANAAQNEIINVVTIFLSLTVGSTMTAERFLDPKTLAIFFLGLVAFAISTAGGVLFGKVMYYFTKGKINPLIGAAGVSAVPMSARVVNRVGLEANPRNFLLMHAMGPNVTGVIGSAIAGGVLLGFLL